MEFKYVIAGHGVFDTIEQANEFKQNMYLAEPETDVGEPEMLQYNPDYTIKWCGDIIWDIMGHKCVHFDMKQRPAKGVDLPIDIRKGQVIPRYFKYLTTCTNTQHATSEMATAFKRMKFRLLDENFVERLR